MNSKNLINFPFLGDRRTFRAGIEHLRATDPKMRTLVDKYGIIKLGPGGDIFESLVESIISQQLNSRAASSIFGRLKGLFDSGTIEATTMSKVRASSLAKVGVSPQKIGYLKDLSSRVVTGEVDLDSLRHLPDDRILETLDGVRGIGPWTVHMLLIFTLGRPDVLPVDDFGIRTALKQVYSLRKLPKPKKIEALAVNWHPFCSIASLYLWRSRDPIEDGAA